MAYKVTSLIVFAVCRGQHARAVSKDVTHIGKAMPKAFVPTGHVPRRSGSMLVNRADAVAQAKSDAAATYRFPVHEAPSSNQFDSALRMQETPINKQSEEQKEVVQHLRARVQPMPQADAKDAQYRLGFGILMFLMVSVGLVASIGTAVIQQYLARVQQTLESTIPASVASDTNNRTKRKRRVWIWQTQHDRCPKPSLLATSEKTLDPLIKFAKYSEEDCAKVQLGSFVSISNPKTGQSVTLIGVFHRTAQSIQQVKRLIEELQPEAVMIELDPSRVNVDVRVARVTDSEDIDVPISASPAMDKGLVGIVRKAFVEIFDERSALAVKKNALAAHRDDSFDSWADANANANAMDIYRLIDESFERAEGQKTGGECDFLQAIRSAEDCTVCNGEFLQAIRSAEDCPVCDTVILGDHSCATSSRRFAELAIENGELLVGERMSRLEPEVRKKLSQEKGLGRRLCNYLQSIMCQKEEDVNDDYTVEFETAMLKTLKQDFQFKVEINQALKGPACNQAMVKERDYLMSESIRRELERRPEEVKTVVGVVGSAHVPGMERHFKAVFADEPAPLEQEIAAAATK